MKRNKKSALVYIVWGYIIWSLVPVIIAVIIRSMMDVAELFGKDSRCDGGSPILMLRFFIILKRAMQSATR